MENTLCFKKLVLQIHKNPWLAWEKVKKNMLFQFNINDTKQLKFPNKSFFLPQQFKDHIVVFKLNSHGNYIVSLSMMQYKGAVLVKSGID